MRCTLTLFLYIEVVLTVVAAESTPLWNRLEGGQKMKLWLEIAVKFQFDDPLTAPLLRSSQIC